MLRFLILALMLVPAAPVVIPVSAPHAQIEQNHATVFLDATGIVVHDHDGEEDTSPCFTPMQEEIIADHHQVFSPFVESLWTRHVAIPAAPLFPIARGDLFRPPQAA